MSAHKLLISAAAAALISTPIYLHADGLGDSVDDALGNNDTSGTVDVSSMKSVTF